MAAPRTIRRAGGGLALEVEALKIAGATVGQALVFQSDGAGGVEGVPGAPSGGATNVGDLLDIGAMGEDIALADNLAQVLVALGGASALRTALFGPYDDDMSGTDWSLATPSGGALATWAGSKLTLDCDAGSAGSCGASKATALPARDEYSIAIRVQVVNGDNSNQTRIILACGRSATDCAKMALFTNGSIEVGATVGGSYVYWYVASTIAAIDPTARTGGELWLRFDRRVGVIAWSYGINTGTSGDLPTVWTEVYSSTERHVAGADAAARNGKKAANGTFVGIYAVTLSGVNLDVAVLAIKTGPALSFGGV